METYGEINLWHIRGGRNFAGEVGDIVCGERRAGETEHDEGEKGGVVRTISGSVEKVRHCLSGFGICFELKP